MKRIIVAGLLATLQLVAAAQCNSVGWTLVAQKAISVTERQCIYEKNGARVSIIVSGFCPFSPC